MKAVRIAHQVNDDDGDRAVVVLGKIMFEITIVPPSPYEVVGRSQSQSHGHGCVYDAGNSAFACRGIGASIKGIYRCRIYSSPGT